MNRTIKFRAWDIRDHRMIPPEEIAEIQNQVDDEIDYVINLTEARHVRPISHVRLLQYTGLKDKNGKEIYEGDVVKLSLDFEDKGRIVETREYGLNIVIYDSTQARFRLKEMVVCGPDWLQNDLTRFNCEIVGNIFENSDLLK